MNRLFGPRRHSRARQVIGILTLLWACSFIVSNGISPAIGITDVEDVLIIDSLENNTYTWRLDKALGIFAANDLHPGNLLKAKVINADQVNLRYDVEYYMEAWGNSTFNAVSNITNSQYFFVMRHWTNISQFTVLPQCIAYWNEVSAIGSKLEIVYGPEFIHGDFIDTVTIKCEWNATNWFRVKFSRAEGILLQLDIQVYVPNALGVNQDLRGNLLINHDSQTYTFALTIWHYIIWFAVIVAAVLTVVTVISIIVSRRKAAAMRLNY